MAQRRGAAEKSLMTLGQASASTQICMVFLDIQGHNDEGVGPSGILVILE
jgi:hypothetical protein